MKNIQASLYLVIVLGLLQTNLCWSQDEVIDFPSVSRSAMGAYQNAPVDYCTGVPDISFGLLGLPTASKDFGYSLSLSYHPNNTALQQKSGELGKGWSVLGIPSITKDIGAEADEHVLFASITDGTDEHHIDDVYYFNINGENGKFRFVYDTITSGISLKVMTLTQCKIDFTYTATTKLKVNSFTITDTNGLVYYFDKYNMERGDRPAGSGEEIRAVFFLTRVHDSNNTQLCSLGYQEVEIFSIYNATRKIKSLYKISEITAAGIGKLKFDYTINKWYHDKNADVARLEAISLTTLNDVLVKKCRFNYHDTDKKTNGLSFLDANSVVVENYKFEYNPVTYQSDDDDHVTGEGNYNDGRYNQGYDRNGFIKIIKKCSAKERIIMTEHANKRSVIGGMLNRVVLPTGGRIDYEFESNTVDPEGYVRLPNLQTFNLEDDFDESLFNVAHRAETFTMKPLDPLLQEDYINSNPDNFYIENLGTKQYNVTTLELPRYFELTQDTELYVLFSGEGNPSPYIEDPAAQTYAIGYEILNASNQVVGSYGISKVNFSNCFKMGDKMVLPAGTYRFRVIAPYGGYVHYTMFAKRRTAVWKSYYYAGGARIKSIKNYENETSQIPIRELSFEYNDFNDPARSSGSIYHTGGHPDLFQVTTAHVLYKNVKVVEANNGYTKYSFYTPIDFTNPSTGEWKYYKPLSQGLLQKRQVFDVANNLLESDRMYYYMVSTGEMGDDLGYYLNPPTIFNIGAIDNYYIMKQYSKTEKYLSGTSPVVLKSVTVNNSWNFKPESTTTFDSQDKKVKTRYYYINELPTTPHASSLTAKNIISSPLVVEQYYDGTLMSKAKSEFESFGNGLFKKARSYVAKGTGDYTLEQRVSKVDNVANKIQEVTNDKGSVTSYIWGYNKTQPVAKIENMAYSAIPAGIISGIQNVSDTPNNEPLIQAMLADLYTNPAFANAMVTTYTYKPLVGIQTVTDSRRNRTTYEYDTFNRLRVVRDKDNNILSENQYNFRPQQN